MYNNFGKHSIKCVTAFVVCLFAFSICPAKGQNVALKTNVLYDATATVNAGVEFSIAPKWTMDISGNYNGWSFSDNRKWKHWLVQPEIRWWFCNKFMRSFLAFHLLGAQYNVGNLPTDFKAFGKDFSSLKNYRYQGWMAGAGIGYGYDWALSRHFNLEFELGMGVIYTGYEKYDCPQCGKKVDENQKFMIAPTKAALSLVYLF